MPKVLRIINRFNLGGITYNVSYLSRYLPPEYETLLIGGPEEAGEESSLFIPGSMGLKPVIIEVMRRSVNPLSDYFAYRKIKKIIKTFRPDIVHTHASKAGAIGRLAAAHCKVPLVVHTFHGHVFKGYFGILKTGFFIKIERYLARKSNAIVAISNKQKKELASIYRICEADKIHVIPLGFDLERFRRNQDEKRKIFREGYAIAEKELAIGIIGRLAPVKNHFLFIEAIEHVIKNSDRKVRALIIGDGELRAELETFIRTKDSAGAFVFTSWIREVDVALAGLDIVCLTSRNEGTPVSLIEAQAASRFIVSTNVGGVEDILHPACGMLSDPAEPGKYKENLLYAVKEFEACQARAGMASEEVIQKFSYQRLCSDMDGLYRRLLRLDSR